MAKVSVKRWLPAVIVFEGAPVNIEVKRQTLDEFLAFEGEYFTYARPMPGGFDAPAEDIEKRKNDMLAWLKQSFTDYVRLPEGEIDDEGIPVTTGEAFYELAAGQLDVKIDVMNQIWSHNRFGEEVRKKLRSLSGSATTSEGQHPELPGPTPEPTAVHADSEDSAPIAAVDQTATQTPSGVTSA